MSTIAMSSSFHGPFSAWQDRQFCELPTSPTAGGYETASTDNMSMAAKEVAITDMETIAAILEFTLSLPRLDLLCLVII
jgi:hypothetical protein